MTLEDWIVARAAREIAEKVLAAEYVTSAERKHAGPLLRATLKLAETEDASDEIVDPPEYFLALDKIRQAYARVSGRRVMSAGGGA